jgi:hypothetical protein
LTNSENKPLMRSLGEFVGHIVKAVKNEPKGRRVAHNKTSRQERRGNITLRRTTIEEIEVDRPRARNQ